MSKKPNEASTLINNTYEIYLAGDHYKAYCELKNLVQKFIFLKTNRIRDLYFKEEMLQEIDIALWEAFIDYDISKCSFRTYIQNILFWKISYMFNKHNNQVKRCISLELIEGTI
jgi:hypothetical protein